jgi:hypothetical protein
LAERGLVFALLPLNGGQKDGLVKRQVSVASDGLNIRQAFRCSIERLVQDRGELEVVANQDDTKAAEVLVTTFGKDLSESLVDPGKRFKTQHALLVDHEVADAIEPPLQGVEDRRGLCERTVVTVNR